MSEQAKKLKALLRDLFQFDSADLDFGIYRIMNYKREAIERFIDQDLIAAVSQQLESGMLAAQSQALAELREVSQKVRDDFGEYALNSQGELDTRYLETRLGQQYLRLRQQAAGAQSRAALEATVYNHLYSFFSRYYDRGDFISKRRYSRQQKYAIPYNGEEVYLYWANQDQYYVKSGEYFTNYRYKAPNGWTVDLKLQTVDVERDNVKGDKRFFLPLASEVTSDASTREVLIPFQFRPLTEGEQTRYGSRKQQEAILAEALQRIPKQLQKQPQAVAAVEGLHHSTDKGEPVSLLAYHLRQYTEKNSSDFFIHKDLKGFLTRELDFYVKNELLNLDDLEAGGEARAEGWFQLLRAIRAIGLRIIEFLAQIEEFQKRLFEKKKFITDTEYCITVQNIPEQFHAEIAANDAQWAEWGELFAIDERARDLFTVLKGLQQRRLALLQRHPTLVLDTVHFDHPFVDRLLAHFDDLDSVTDGLLVHGENFQALNLLLAVYRGKVKCVYTDPPFNTAGSAILYKNDYRHSSWLSLVAHRIEATVALMDEDCVLCIAIDDFELPVLCSFLRRQFGESSHLASVVVRSNPHGRAMASGFSRNHEYALFFVKSEKAMVGRLPRDETRLARYPESDDRGRFAWINFRKTGAGSTRAERPKLFYPVYVSKRGEIRVPQMTWAEEEGAWQPIESVRSDEVVVLPRDADQTERVWNMGWARARRERTVNLEARLVNGEWQIYRKYRPNQQGALPGTWWHDKKYSATESGTRILKALLGERELFSYPKSVFLVEDCLRAAHCLPGSNVLDIFAGSGTTAHATISLNREDGGERQFVLVEVGDYFDTALLPRVKKVTFSPQWKGGKPERLPTPEEAERSPRLVKVIRLESYEDALNNIAFTPQEQQWELQFDDYLLKYMLDWETKDSPTWLNIDKLASPFRYQLKLTEGQETRTKTVDLPETFNYLLGLHVRTRHTHVRSVPVRASSDTRNARARASDAPNECRYLVFRGTVDHRQVTVIWRDTAGWIKEDYEQDKEFVAQQSLTEGADDVYVNGDSLIPDARSLDGVFKSLMFGS